MSAETPPELTQNARENLEKLCIDPPDRSESPHPTIESGSLYNERYVSESDITTTAIPESDITYTTDTTTLNPETYVSEYVESYVSETNYQGDFKLFEGIEERKMRTQDKPCSEDRDEDGNLSQRMCNTCNRIYPNRS